MGDWLPFVVLVVLLVLGVSLIIWVNRWRANTNSNEPDSLDYYRDMLDQGLLSSDEFAQIERKWNDSRQAGQTATNSEQPKSSSSDGDTPLQK